MYTIMIVLYRPVTISHFFLIFVTLFNIIPAIDISIILKSPAENYIEHIKSAEGR